MTQTERYWLAGLLEGEGCFTLKRRSGGRYVYPYIQIEMADVDPIARAAKIMGTTCRGPYSRGRKNWADTWQVSVGGKRALELMVSVYKIMSPRRQEQIDKCKRETTLELPSPVEAQESNG